MLNRSCIIIFAVLSVLLGVCCAAEPVEEQTGDWSDIHEHLKARLHLKHRFVMGSNSEVLVYLELCNTCPPEGTVRVTFPFSSVSNLSFLVKDSEGNEIKLPQKPLFCSTIYDPTPFDLTLPQDCTMRFSVSQNGGGVSQKETLLCLVPGRGWNFKHGENKTYELSATLSVAQSERYEDRHWAGELKLPPVRIPIPEARQNEPAEDTHSHRN